VYIDATYNTSKEATHLYGIVGEEDGYGVPLGFMLMEIVGTEDMATPRNQRQAIECIKKFYAKAKELELNPKFLHSDKDWAQITPARVLACGMIKSNCRTFGLKCV
jgi:hypothetical protein